MAKSLLSSIMTTLGLETPQPPAPAPPDPNAQRRQRFEAVSRKMSQVIERLTDRMDLLQAACHQVQLLPAPGKRPNKSLAAYVTPIAMLLRENRRAAQMVSSVLLQYQEACKELHRIEAGLQGGKLDDLSEEESKGKFYYLLKIHHSFKDFPLLCDLFPTPASAPSAAMAPAAHEAPAATPTMSATRPSAESQEVNRRRLIDALKPRVDVLKAALGTTASEALPPASGKLARNLGSLFAKDPASRRLASEIVDRYEEASALMRGAGHAARLQELSSWLLALPQRVRGNSLLGQVFSQSWVG